MAKKQKAASAAKDDMPVVAQAIELTRLVLEADVATVVKGFDYNASLFVAYVRQFLSTTKKGPVLAEGKSLTLSVFGEMQKFTVKEVSSGGTSQEEDGEESKEIDEDPTADTVINSTPAFINYVVSDATEIVFVEAADTDLANVASSSSKDFISGALDVEFAGFDEQLESLQEVLQLKLVEEALNGSVKGVLIHGPAGIGKTLAVATVMKRVRDQLSELDGSELLIERLTPADLVQAKDQNKYLKAVFERVKTSSGRPSILWVEEIDYIAKTKNLFYSFLAELDQLQAERLIVLATTSKLNDVDKALRRGGRLDIDVRFDMPTARDRQAIIKVHLARLENAEVAISDDDLTNVANASSGFASSDIAQIVRNAFLTALKRQRNQQSEAESSVVIVTKNDIEQAVIAAKPLSIQDLLVEVPKTLWSEIGGNDSVKFQVRQCVEWPLKYPDKFFAVGIKPPQGILLYGPPGCSKTMIAKALATESGLNFIAIKGPELFSKYVGDTEKAIREIFRKARLSSPSIIFFDEIDAMATQRGDDETSVSDRALCQLLNEMDGVESRSQVIVVAATNRLDIIDSALLRPGRFDRLVHVPLPDEHTRADIFRINVQRMQYEESALEGVDALAKSAAGFSGAEIALVCREAGLLALTEDAKIETAEACDIRVTLAHLEQALAEVKVRGKKDKIIQEQQQQ